MAFFYILILTVFVIIHIVYSFNCNLPEQCRLESQFSSISTAKIERDGELSVLKCHINDAAFEFKYKEPTPLISSEKCVTDEKTNMIQYIIFQWQSKEVIVLEKRLNFTNAIRYYSYFKDIEYLFVRLSGIKGFDVSILDVDYVNNNASYLGMVELINFNLDFYHEKKKINSCQDIKDFNITRIESIFQIKTQSGIQIDKLQNIQIVCPLVFWNADIYRLVLNHLIDTFYETRNMKFSDEVFPKLNSQIKVIEMYNVVNINLDLSLINPSVFNYTRFLKIASASLNSIDGEIFNRLNSLLRLYINPMILKKINHKQGIKWIRQWNYGLNASLREITLETMLTKEIVLEGTYLKPFERFSKIFPDEDFCLYVDFPFNQLLVIYQFIDTSLFDKVKIEDELTCTHLWLVRYYEFFYAYFSYAYGTNHPITLNINRVLNSTELKSISKCDFEKKSKLCNKTNYQNKDIWDRNDFLILNKKLQTAFKISLYPIAFLGLITNTIVVVVILKKENSDLFKEFKQYSYLYLNSIFCIMILVIELLSWITECFYPYQVFCPQIHKLVAFQFFKIIFKECLVTVFKFMCSFTYFAFALNRISLIGKDHGKFVTFFSEVGIKKYIAVSLLISCSLSWIKYFKYEVNYSDADSGYPMYILSYIITYSTTSFNEFFVIYNLISDIINYAIFVLICFIIDICMVVQLRRTLAEQEKKRQSIFLFPFPMKQNINIENEDPVNKAIKMVVLNSLIGIFFKLPVCISPLINLYAKFYYKSKSYRTIQFNFNDFFTYIMDSGFFTLFDAVSQLLFALSLSIQMFIYKRFDKKFRTGYDRIKDNCISDIKKRFSSSNQN